MQEGHKQGGLFLFFCLGLIAGVALFSLRSHSPQNNDIDFYVGQKVVFLGTVVSEPRQKNQNQELDLRVEKFVDGEKVFGKIRLNINLYPQFNYGDYLKVTCTPEKPQNTTFNYQRYLARFNIYASCFKPHVEKIEADHGNFFIKTLLTIKQKSKSTIEKGLGEPEASLIAPVLFGGGDELGDDLTNNFRRTGLTHIMAVSGFNVGILAAGITYLLFLLGWRRQVVFVISSLITIAYVILVGAPSSAVRAGIMSIIVLFSLAIGRLARFSRVVIITAAGTLVFNPLLLSADIGWQLSFCAILGLIYLYPIIKKFIDKIFFSRFKILGDIVAATIAAQLSTTPISLYHFGQVSLIAPLANILVVWTIPFLTAASAIALPLAWLFPSISSIVFLPSWLIAKYIFVVVNFLANLSWAAFSIDK